MTILPVVILLNGLPMPFDMYFEWYLPYRENGVTMMPVALTAKKIGAVLVREPSTESATLFYQGRSLTIPMINKISYIPLRTLAQLMKAEVSYNPKYGTASLTTTKKLPVYLQKPAEQRLRELLLQADSVTMEVYNYEIYGTEGPTVTTTKVAETTIAIEDIRPFLQNLGLSYARYEISTERPLAVVSFRHGSKELGRLWIDKFDAQFSGNADLGLSMFVLDRRSRKSLDELIVKYPTLGNPFNYQVEKEKKGK